MRLPPALRSKATGPWTCAVYVRPFVPNDIPAIATLVRDALRENYPMSIYLDIHRWWRDGFLVADFEGHPIGFLAAIVPGDGQARVLMLAVATGYRSRGIGTALMHAFMQGCESRGLRRIELEVRVSNQEAIRFYQRFGFAITHTLPRFYTDGEDGYKMIRIT